GGAPVVGPGDGAVRPSPMRSPVARSSNRAKATVSPSSARVSFEDIAPISRANPPMRSSHSRQRQLAPVRGVDRPHDLRQSWPFILNAEPLARMGDARRLVSQRLEES